MVVSYQQQMMTMTMIVIKGVDLRKVRGLKVTHKEVSLTAEERRAREKLR